jgi:hypothetical protein
MVFGRGKEKPIQGLNSNENPVYNFDIKVGDFMKKKKVRLAITNHRLLLVDRDTNNISEQYDLSNVTVLVVGRFTGVTTSGVMKGQIRDTGKLRFVANGVTLGETKNMFNPDDPANGITRLINSHNSSSVKPIPQNPEPIPTSSNQKEDPLKILNLRFAKGEITKQEFEEIKELIQ